MTSGSLIARVAPPSLAGSRARHIVERNLLVYRRGWLIFFSGILEPVFYLLSIGIGLGDLVGLIDGPAQRTVSYAAFVAPALLAASAMNGAVYESTFNIFFKLKYDKTYDAMLATPIQPADIAVGEIAWSQIRGLMYAIGFVGVMFAMGLATSPLALLALPAAILIGFAFGAVGMAATTYMKSWQHFDLVQLVTLPLFLFSATFYPLEVYPAWLQTATRLSPLYHGVELTRAFTLGVVDSSIVGHAGVLAAMGLGGLLVVRRRLQLLLMP